MKLNKIITKKTLLIIGIFLLISGCFWAVFKFNRPQQVITANVEELAKPTVQKDINQTFEFEIPNPGGQKIILKYTITKAKIVRYITKANEPINLAPDQSILILTLELQNDSKYALKVKSQDFVRMVDEAGKKYAADFYNGEIDVAPISVTEDELGYTVTTGQKQFNFQVGEVDKDKQDVQIVFE